MTVALMAAGTARAKVGQHVVPIWLVAVLLVSVVRSGVLAYYVWRTLNISVEVKEPIGILYYPSEQNLYPGKTKYFNITLEDKASR